MKRIERTPELIQTIIDLRNKDMNFVEIGKRVNVARDTAESIYNEAVKYEDRRFLRRNYNSKKDAGIINFWVPMPMKEQFKSICKAKGYKVSVLLRKIVEDYCMKEVNNGNW